MENTTPMGNPSPSPVGMPPKPQNQLLIPLSIVIAGALIAGAVFLALYLPKAGTGIEVQSASSIDPKTLPSLAASIKVDKKKVEQCLSSGKYETKVAQMSQDAQTAGANGTPFSVIISKAKVGTAVRKLVTDTNNQFKERNPDYPDVLYVAKDGHSIAVSGALPLQLITQIIDGLVLDNKKPTTTATPKRVVELTADEHIYGSPTAPVVIVEYSDTDCPYCQLFHPTAKTITDKYKSTGEVAWAYRHFDTKLHQNTVVEAVALECVAEIGGNDKFWEFLDLLFSKKDFSA